MVASVTTPATGASESRPFSPSQSWEQCVKSEVETLSPTRVKLSVEVPFEELKPNMDTAYRTIGQQISVPGFRKGKVPARIIDSRVGRGAVLQEAINDALPQLYSKAVAEAKVKPMAQPEVEITDIPDPSEGGDLKFVAEIDVQPEVTLPEYSSLEVQLEPIVVNGWTICASGSQPWSEWTGRPSTVTSSRSTWRRPWTASTSTRPVGSATRSVRRPCSTVWTRR
jgi:hypothetical protein